MPKTLKFRGLKCPHCGYSLEGLANPICPECGEEFKPDWLYSADYEHAFQWTRRRKFLAGALGALMGCAIIGAAIYAGGSYACMLLALAGIALIVFVRRICL